MSYGEQTDPVTTATKTPEDYLREDYVNDQAEFLKRFASMERRLRELEKRGALLPNLDEENIFFYLTVAYVVFGFVLPAVFRLFGQKVDE